MSADVEPDVEIERKYLLHGLPPRVLGERVVDVEQGYLPGKKLVERLRRVRDAEGVRCYRTVKAGSGMRRIELEEEAPADLFDAMWPFTQGKRVLKRRYYVKDGDVTWEIDEFTDRELVLAEVELEREDQEVVMPEWLAPYLVREVTGEGTYQNSRLAK